jgi:hypothetical protein
VAVTNQRRRNWIRTLFELAEENHISFQDQLRTSRKEASEAGFSGVITSMSGNGISTAFAGMTAADAEEAIGWIEDLFDKAVADLEGQGTTFSDPKTADEQTVIKNTMLLLTPQKVRTVYNDFSGMRP